MYSAATIVHQRSGNVTIEELNEELFPLHIPALIFVVVCMIVGIVGNSFVIIIYKKKFRHSNHRYFILFLAVTDLVACCTGMPFLVASLRLPYLMTSNVICKGIRYLHYFVNNSSGLLLVVISIERFRKICRPLKKQLTHRQVLYLCWGVIAFSVVMASPSGVLYTTSPIHTGIANLTGYQCYVNEDRSAFFKGYMSVLLAETLISIAIFAVIYTFIIRTLWKSDQFLSSMRSTYQSSATSRTHHSSSADFDAMEFPSEKDSDQNSPDATDGSISSIPAECIDKNKNKTHIAVSKSQTLCNFKNSAANTPTQSERSLINGDTDTESFNKRHTTQHFSKTPKHEQSKDNVKRAKSDPTLNRINKIELSPVGRLAYTNALAKAKRNKHQRRPGKHSRATARVTIMLLTVSVFFAIAFIPHLVLMFIAKSDRGFVDGLSKKELIVFQVFLRIFIINNVVNPIIYLVFDSKFRMLSKEVIKGRCSNTRSLRRR